LFSAIAHLGVRVLVGASAGTWKWPGRSYETYSTAPIRRVFAVPGRRGARLWFPIAKKAARESMSGARPEVRRG
jgi:hypothetical protein